MRSTFPVLFLSAFLVALGACGGGDTLEPGTPQGQVDDPAPEELREEPWVGKRGLEALDAFIAEQKVDRDAVGWKTSLPKPPQVEFEAGKTWFWVLDTNQGTMRFRLFPDIAPMHVSSTAYLTRLGFYDGTGFHRVIQGFMAQGGDPLGTGSGGPGYQYAGEFSPKARHDRAGLLSMANAGANTDGSQFFITFKPTPHLNDKHTIFGEIVEGEDVLRDIEALGQPGRARSHTPKEPIVIEKARIEVE